MINGEKAFKLSTKRKHIVDEVQEKVHLKRSENKVKNLIKYINKQIRSAINIGETYFCISRRDGYSIPYIEDDEMSKLISHYEGLGYSVDFGNNGDYIKVDWSNIL